MVHAATIKKRLVGLFGMARSRFGPVAAMVFLAGCGDPAEPQRATRLAISPTSVALSYVGETATVAATVTEQHGKQFEGAVSWSSSDVAVFAVDDAGVVTAVANGAGTLRASIADLSAEAMVTVRQAADSVAVVSGSGQRAVQGSTLRDSVVVQVLDQGGTAVAAATVDFVPGDGGSANPSSAQTDATGRAATLWTLGPATGSQSLAVRVPDGPSAEAGATALTPAEATDSIEVVLGANRRAAPGHTLPVVVRLLDEHGRPVPRATVDFAPGQGQGTASPASVETGEDGLAATDWALGGGSEPQMLNASVENGPASVTTATVVAPGAVRATMANPQGASGRPAPVSAQLVDAGGNPLEGSVRFEPAEGHGTVDMGDGPVSSAIVRTDTTGTGSVVWTPMGDVAGQPAQTITVAVDGFSGVPALDIDLRIVSGICYRTPQVVADLLFKLTPIPSEPKHCADVTLDDLDSTPNMGLFAMPNDSITSLKSWDFAGIDVTVMILSGNQLTELPSGVFSGLPNLFPGLPNFALLALEGNRLTASAFDEIRHLSGFEFLEMGANPLTEIPEGAFDNLVELEVLNLGRTNLRTLPANAFRNLSKLKSLSLILNEELRTVKTDMFQGMPALYELDLSRTGIETIEAGAFNGLQALQILDIGNTSRLTTLPAGAFRGLSTMSTLWLDSMAVNVIEPGAFDGLDSLKFLLVERTQLADWAAGTFRGMPQMESLWLRDNPRLTALPANAFDGAPKLRQILVTNGPLSAVEPGAFDGLTGLQRLVLEGNRLVAWPAGAFRGPSALELLSLAGNGIRAVPAAAFDDQPGLSALDLSDNAIAAWPKPAFQSLRSLAALNMSDNELSELPPDALAGLASSLMRIDLRENPGAPFAFGLQLERIGSGNLKEGDPVRIRATTAFDVPTPFATRLAWTANGDVVGLAKGRANLATGALATDPWALSGDNNGASGGAQVAVTAVAQFESDSIFGLAPRFADTLVLDFAADSTRTNRRPVTVDSIPPVTLAPGDAGEPDTVTVNVAAYFTDPDGDSLVYEAVPASRIVDANIEGDSLTLVSLLPGRTSVEVRAFDPGGFVAVLDLAVTVRGAFDMEIVYIGDISDEHKEIFEDAAKRWESIFVEGLADIDFSENPFDTSQRCRVEGGPTIADLVSDVRIFATVRAIDGEGSILARAGPCALRRGGTDNFLPVLGIMEFDEADIPFLASQPAGLSGTILHEMAHVLGLGTIWGEEETNLLRNPSVGATDAVDTHFVGELAIAAFDAAGGVAYTDGAKVPVDNTGIPGSADGHWRESILVTELMTPRYDPGNNPLSAITIQSMADLGYEVNVSEADDYGLPSAGGRALADRRCVAGRCIDLSADIRRGPIVLVGSDGRITDVIRR